MTKKIILPCPTCETPHEYNAQSAYRPFCSERCKLIDLGEWASETRRIAGKPTWEALDQHNSDYNEH